MTNVVTSNDPSATKPRVMVAMSGGVDSSVAAGLMVEAGYEVIGFTMKLRDATPEEQGGQKGSCCSPDDLMDARVACDALGIPHYVVDYREVFKAEVIDPFAESYLNGRTPNPCVNCNDKVKFAPLLERAKALGAQYLVTGHYAQIKENVQGDRALFRGADRQKDQSYFLFGMSQEALDMTLFPLGSMVKDEVREHAQRLGLLNWDKADSEDICFVPQGNYADVIEKIVGEERTPQSGPIVDQSGKQVGVHNGLHHYTIGQRRGVGVSTGERVYVVDIKPETRTLVVGPPHILVVQGLRALNCRFRSSGTVLGIQEITAQIRYRNQGFDAQMVLRGDVAEVYFSSPQSAVTPGQAVVFYKDDEVMGGGWIETSITTEEAPQLM
jgi:tRNA-uridine 2-sulfurtransferase